jgi:hypothetical protein
MGKTRCPLHPASMTLTRDRPEILTPPEHPPACCAQQTITVPPHVAAKTRQKHDYPSRDHRRSYARRTGAERTFATAKDPATNNITRGWTRLMGLPPLTLWLACLLAVRNQRILTAWDAAKTTTPAAPRPGCRPGPAAGAARPSPPPQHPHNRSSTSSRRLKSPQPRPESRTSCPGQQQQPQHRSQTSPSAPTREPRTKCQT